MYLLIFNFIEGFWWTALGGWIFLSKNRLKKSPCKTSLGIVLILFGISDFVEMGTGAWWQPWWLLIWKGLCVTIGLILLILFFMKGDHNETEN